MERITIVSIASAVKEIPVIMDTDNVKNGTVSMLTGILLNTEYKLTFTPSDGFDFDTFPTFTIYNSDELELETVTTHKEGNVYVGSFTISEDTDKITISCYGIANPVTELSSLFPFVNVYKVTKDDIQTLENKRFIKTGQESASPFDLSRYMYGLYRPFAPVETGDKSKVFFGQYDMGLECPVLSKQNTIVDFEGVTINETYKNAVDYDSVINLYLPFIGIHELKTAIVMGKAIALKYVIDNLTGDATCYVMVNGDLLDAISTTVKMETPYNESFTENVNITGSIRNNHYQYDLVPKILIDTPVPFSEDFNHFNDTDYYSRVDNEQGYIEGDIFVEDINGQDITYDEKTEIKRLFRNGVIV